MSWSPADDYDDHGNYAPGPYPTYPRFTRCQPGCCTGTPLCHDTEETTMTEQTVPALPTLADMTDGQRAACLRMQCDTAPNRSVRGFIADIYPGGCRVIERDTWEWLSCSDDMVTPRPDLPRLEWPSGREDDQ